MTNMDQSLAGWIVVELGDRRACSACGQLLAQAGATVIVVEPEFPSHHDKWMSRATFLAGKRSLVWREKNSDDLSVLRSAIEGADVVLLSSDLPTPLQTAAAQWLTEQHVVCDIMAKAGKIDDNLSGLSDKLIQANSGMAAVTGLPGLPPAVSDVPVVEFHAAAYAASAIVAAMRARRLFIHKGQRIDVGLYECGVNSLATFLPLHYGGQSVSRAGNRHPMASPWNAYQANDGWVLICSATDEHWARLCNVMDVPGLAAEGPLARLADRVRLADDVDRHVSNWTRERPVEDIITMLTEAGIASGPILGVSKVFENINVRHRKMALLLRDPVTGANAAVPGTPLKASRTPGTPAISIPAPDADRAFVRSLEPRPVPLPGTENPAAPCTGLTIIEIGQYTTAPLAAKQLAALGAEVIKIEPLKGEATRAWPPLRNGTGYFFSMTNNGKRSAALDLRNPADAGILADLVARADVLIENMKPGSLQRLGFSPERLAYLNPRLVYCAISGFGAESAFPGRPAFDTVIQAMSGLMDLTRVDGTPTKLGISAADITGALVALFAVLAMLEYRDRSGNGQAIDLAMQDAALWATQTHWNQEHHDLFQMVACADGFVATACTETQLQTVLDEFSAERNQLNRTSLIALLNSKGIPAVAVRTVPEIADDPETTDSGLVVWKQGEDLDWPLLSPPYKLSATPALTRELIGSLGEMNGTL